MSPRAPKTRGLPTPARSPASAMAALRRQRPAGGVNKDPLDLRDFMYEGSLLELPFTLDNRRKVPRILDQGKEGACTGFGLAAVVNFLLHARVYPPRRKDFASARMLYEMAKRYDEWKGQKYDGSSIRGAMKGWHKHGVCRDQLWPYVEEDPGRLTPRREQDAWRRPLGSYFRVRHHHLNHMQSALREAGILYASSDVHEGWYEVSSRNGLVPFSKNLVGGHAYAIVGYDERGFWVQNSWGPRWGLKGFCHISYDDWLENGYDCWVARLGVPTLSAAMAGSAGRRRVASFDHIPHEEVVYSAIRPHYVNLGNDGRFSTSGTYSSDAEEVQRILHEEFPARAAGWTGRPRLLLYAHGGLNDEKASASQIASLLPSFLANQLYPLHFMWETGFLDSVQGIVQDAFRRSRMQGWSESLRDKFFDLLDEAIELGSRPLGLPIWRQIKDNARRASAEPEGGARFVAAAIAAERAAGRDVELHLAGHSAGAIFHAHLIPQLAARGVPIKSLTLYAPACTISLFKSSVLPHLGKGIERLTIFNLNDGTEKDDRVGPAYHKSLLYLVSEAFEERKKEPLLGLESFLTQDRDLTRALGAPAATTRTAVIYSRGGAPGLALTCASSSHGRFDNDQDTLTSTLRIIRGSNRIDRPF